MQVKNTLIKLVVIAAVMIPYASAAQTSSINAFSPYTMYGIGEQNTPGTLPMRSMGGVGVAMRSSGVVNLLNPAAFSAAPQKSFLFNFGLEGQNYYNSQKVDGMSKSTAYNTFNFHDIAFQLPLAKKLGLGIGIVGLYNIQFIVDKSDHVYIIEVNPRSSRTVPFLSKATGYQLADIATNVILGTSLKEQGIFDLYPPEKERCYVKAPVFSFAKLHGLDAYLSPEMKSTGEAIGYDKKLSRAMYKALQASGMNVQNYGTVFVTLADEDKPEGLPLVRRFYEMGFNIEATAGTAAYLKSFGIRTRVRGKISDGSHEILDSIRSGYVSYIINTRSIHSSVHAQDGAAIRRCAVENGVTVFTSLDTVRVLLDVLEETTLAVSTIHAE